MCRESCVQSTRSKALPSDRSPPILLHLLSSRRALDLLSHTFISPTLFPSSRLPSQTTSSPFHLRPSEPLSYIVVQSLRSLYFRFYPY